MSLSTKISMASRGSTEPRQLFAAPAQAFGRERNKRAMMSLSTKISSASEGSTEPRQPFAAPAQAFGRERHKPAMMSLSIKGLGKLSGAQSSLYLPGLPERRTAPILNGRGGGVSCLIVELRP
jgi:hypothetical protein